jgi:hypothetical protein
VRGGIRERILLGLIVCTVARAGAVMAQEQESKFSGALFHPASIGAEWPMTSVDPRYALAQPQIQNLFGADFRPRAASLSSLDPAPEPAPTLRSTTVWQRMEDYKSRSGLRLLTLWEWRAGTLSLQAGRKGDPSLQWTSRSLNRGAATRGLLDHLLSESMDRVNKRARSALLSAGAPLTPRSEASNTTLPAK